MRTRFAPSPTGPLHLGHAYSAILGHDMARAEGGLFLLRMEDTEFDRAKTKWDDLIQKDLRWLGVAWDGEIRRQSEHLDRYDAGIAPLIASDLLYPCSCSRGDIRGALAAPQEGVATHVYPGTCRGRSMSDKRPGDALRLDLSRAFETIEGPVKFSEIGPTHTGDHVIDPTSALREIGDIVLTRKSDGLVAYFLASAFDDADAAITHVVRGEDLFQFTPVQVVLQRLLGLPTPVYHHHRLIRDETGKRLAKRDDARAISKYREDGATPEDVRKLIGL